MDSRSVSTPFCCCVITLIRSNESFFVAKEEGIEKSPPVGIADQAKAKQVGNFHVRAKALLNKGKVVGKKVTSQAKIVKHVFDLIDFEKYMDIMSKEFDGVLI